MKNIVCLISGRGSNLEALLRRQYEEQWQAALGARVVAVIADRAAAAGLAVAAAHGVAARVIPHRSYADRSAFEAALRAQIDDYEPALVVLAGFLRVLTPAFVEHYSARLINIHPSLLPAFSGLGTHQRALDAGVRVHGATVHYVTAELDAGPIIAQAALAVDATQTAASLAARVLALEHVLLPRCVRWLLEDRVSLEGGQVRTRGLAAHELLLGPE